MAVGFSGLCATGICVALILAGNAFSRSAHDNSRQRSTAHLAFSLLADELKECRTDTDCVGVVHPRVGPMTKCIATKVCFPPDSADNRDLPPGSCSSHQDCGAYFMCLRTQCLFIGPKGCSTEADCPQGSPLLFECAERSGLPGTKCYIKCSTDDDCYLCDGTMCHHAYEETVQHYGCCQGFCQKKRACRRLTRLPYT
ncbi:hypothetical protein RvY_11700 [Ramazzottius varieornatus]|uniref:Uncharacterized protein n=1 Tax=Ramazzottius varieornatus TaxID=947166 RepID=A0A1D1VMD9_RAMVA|nr:hypothetical protein RvY_11700 [Ramazzottius varieornatus]